MEALLISIINLTIVSIFLILFKKKSCLLKTIAFISISFSVTVLCLFYLFNNSFGASTPVNIKSKNETNQTVEIYSIVFWDEPFVFYDKKLNPNEKSTDFWFEVDGAEKFWLIAKNKKGEIIYLKEFSNLESTNYTEKIKEVKSLIIENISISETLISKFDKKHSTERKLFWINCLLIFILLIISFRKKNSS